MTSLGNFLLLQNTVSRSNRRSLQISVIPVGCLESEMCNGTTFELSHVQVYCLVVPSCIVFLGNHSLLQLSCSFSITTCLN